MTYLNDDEWNKAKTVAKTCGFAGSWVDIVDYYYTIGGMHVHVYAILNAVKYRILRILDNEEVLVMDKDSNLHVRAYDEITKSRKQFFFSDNAMVERELTLPENCLINAKQSVKIYV